MGDLDLVHSYVGRLLREWFCLPQVVRDADGDYPFRFGTAVAYVRVLDRDPAVVQVFAGAVHGVRIGPELLTELNDTNANVTFARVYLSGTDVWVQTELWAETMTGFTLGMACERVGELADRIGPAVAAVYGGCTDFSIREPEGEDPQPP